MYKCLFENKVCENHSMFRIVITEDMILFQRKHNTFLLAPYTSIYYAGFRIHIYYNTICTCKFLISVKRYMIPSLQCSKIVWCLYEVSSKNFLLVKWIKRIKRIWHVMKVCINMYKQKKNNKCMRWVWIHCAQCKSV